MQVYKKTKGIANFATTLKPISSNPAKKIGEKAKRGKKISVKEYVLNDKLIFKINPSINTRNFAIERIIITLKVNYFWQIGLFCIEKLLVCF